MREDRVRVLVTGTAWLGGGTGAIESELNHLFREARQEVMLSAYAIGSSLDLLFDWLEGALARGVDVKLVVNGLQAQPADVGSRLRGLADAYPHMHLYDFVPGTDADLHAKVVVADRKKALVGSSNLSRRGLLTNHELAVLVEGPTAAEIGRVLDRLLANPAYATRVR